MFAKEGSVSFSLNFVNSSSKDGRGDLDWEVSCIKHSPLFSQFSRLKIGFYYGESIDPEKSSVA